MINGPGGVGPWEVDVAEKPLDWDKAQKYLKTMRHAYTDIGAAGTFGLTMVLNPLQIRFEKGERTQKLYDEIMAIK